MSTRVALIADLHFPRVTPGAPEALLEAIAETEPVLVIAAGDFTMAGRRREFEAAARFLGRIDAPIIACPGNHDIPAYNLFERFLRPTGRYERAIDARTLDRFLSDDLAVLAVNSARPANLSFDWSHGRLSRRQIAEAKAFFDRQHAARTKLLVTHHPFVLPPASASFRRIGNADRATAALARAGVHAVLTGHLHKHASSALAVRVGTEDPDLITVQAGTALSNRHRDEPNGFAVLGCGAGVEWIESHRFDGRSFRVFERSGPGGT